MQRDLDVHFGARMVQLARGLERNAHLRGGHRAAVAGGERLDLRAEFEQLAFADHAAPAHHLQRHLRFGDPGSCAEALLELG